MVNNKTNPCTRLANKADTVISLFGCRISDIFLPDMTSGGECKHLAPDPRIVFCILAPTSHATSSASILSFERQGSCEQTKGDNNTLPFLA